MISDKRFDISGGTDRVFNSDFSIKGKLYVRVWVDEIGDESNWIGISPSKFNIINDNVVFDEAPKGKILNLQVATVPSELQASPSEISTIVDLKEEIKALDAIKEAISGVNSIKDSVVTDAGIKDDIVEVSKVSQDVTKLAGEVENIEENRAKAEKAYQDTVQIKQDTQTIKNDTDAMKQAVAQDKQDVDIIKSEIEQIETDIKALDKADKTYVDAELAKKVDTTTMNTELAKKADLDYVNTELAERAGADIVQVVMDNKQEIERNSQDISTKAEQSYVNSEVQRVLNAIPSLSRLPVYTYRGDTLQVLPIDKPYRAYYLSYYAIKNKGDGQSLPNLDLEVGTTIAIENSDINDSFMVTPRNGETIGIATAINLPPESIIYLVKDSPTTWTNVLSGYLAPSLQDLVNTMKYELRDELGGGGGASMTIIGDDDVVNVGVTALKFPNATATTDPNDNKKLDIETYTNYKFMEKDGQAGNSASFKANQVEFLPPLQGFSDPNKDLGVVVELKHNQFENAKAPRYLAYLQETEDVMAKPSGVSRGVLWFDDVVVPNGSFIQIDRNNKTIGLQEWDDKDPNMTGGDAFLVAYRIAMKGVAPADGYVSIQFIEKASGFPAENANGLPMGVQRNYKQGEELGVLQLLDITLAKGLKEYQCIVEHTFSSDPLVIEDRTEGTSGIMIQSITGDEKTSEALLQYENDTLQNIEFSTHYLGQDFFTFAYYLNQNEPLINIPSGQGQTLADGIHLYNPTNIKGGWLDKHLVITDNGSDLAYFNVGKIFSAEQTLMLRDKEINVQATLTDKENAFKISLIKWTGQPDSNTDKVILDETNSQPVLEPNWEIVDSLFISEDVKVGDHNVSKTFTVPNDANNFAIVIYPTTKQTPISLKLKEFKADVVNPFVGYVVDSPQDAFEAHMSYSPQYARFATGLPDGYVSYRFTITKADTKLPAGIKIKGKADVSLAKNWSEGTDFGTEGDIKFDRGGNAKISTTVRVYGGEGLPDGGTTQLTLWWAEKQTDGTFRLINSSELVTTIKKEDKGIIVKMPTFEYLARETDEIRLYAKTGIDDGAYVQTEHTGIYLTDTVIEFDEIAFVKRQIKNNKQYTQDELEKLSNNIDTKLANDYLTASSISNTYALKQGITIADVNTAFEAGLYRVNNDTVGLPTPTQGGLIVAGDNAGSITSQIFVTYIGRIFVRGRDSNTWTSWEELATKSQLSSSVTTASVLNANKGATVGAVGTYAWAICYNDSGKPNFIRAGSDLVYAGLSTSSTLIKFGSGLSGTWRCMGYSEFGSATLWLRIT